MNNTSNTQEKITDTCLMVSAGGDLRERDSTQFEGTADEVRRYLANLISQVNIRISDFEEIDGLDTMGGTLWTGSKAVDRILQEIWAVGAVYICVNRIPRPGDLIIHAKSGNLYKIVGGRDCHWSKNGQYGYRCLAHLVGDVNDLTDLQRSNLTKNKVIDVED